MSNRLIAKFLGVSDVTVMNIRRDMESTAKIKQSTLRIGADGRLIDTANIGEFQSTSDGKSCHECSWYRNGRCMYSYDHKEPEAVACEEFRQHEVKKAEPIPDRTNVKVLDKWGDKTPKRRNLHAYQSRDSITINVPKKIMLAAVELRHVYGQEWLDDLGVYIINMKQQMD